MADAELSLHDVKDGAEKALAELEKLVVALEEAATYLPQVLAVLKVIAGAI